MMRWRRIVTAALVAGLIVSACGADDADDPTTTDAGPERSDETTTTGPDRGDRDLPREPERIPGEDDGATVVGEVPNELLQPVVDDAAARAGVDASAVAVVTAQEMIWPDGSLDCAEPGQAYTQAQVPGYWVIVEAGGAAFDYRLNDSGFFKLCTSPFSGGAGGGTAPTE